VPTFRLVDERVLGLEEARLWDRGEARGSRGHAHDPGDRQLALRRTATRRTRDGTDIPARISLVLVAGSAAPVVARQLDRQALGVLRELEHPVGVHVGSRDAVMQDH
jgi:hypothetical protein